LSRRNRVVPITVVPTLVQGAAAAGQIREALLKAQSLENVDVIIIGRGGGSIEDLWAFNDEALARLIAACPVPVISAVGHEIDFTLADFVADLRAPTPSAAAELVVKSADDTFQLLITQWKRLEISWKRLLDSRKQLLISLQKQLVDPKRRIEDLIIRNDELCSRLTRSSYDLVKRLQLRLQLPNARLVASMEHVLLNRRLGLQGKASVLHSLSPLRVLERGYAVAKFEGPDGEILKRASQVEVDDSIYVRLGEGSLIAKVIEKN
jgi:exodeoxyribonuclease VII large subunit